MEYQNFIINSLQEVAKIAKESFGKVSSTVKTGDNNQVLTETDLQIGKILIEKIKENYPVYNIIDEEAGGIDNSSEFTWTIDPIDGTSNFASAVPTYGIMIGLLQGEAPIAAGIALPFFDEIFIGEKGKGSYCNGRRVYVTKEENLSSVLISYGIDGHKEKPEMTEKECKILKKIILSIRNLRSSNSSFDVAMVLKGSYGAWLNQTQKIWDNVPEHLLIEEAGGKVTDFYGNPLSYNEPLKNIGSNFTICAGSFPIHKALQEIIKSKSSV